MKPQDTVRKRILVVDDEPVILEAARELLQSEGYEVLTSQKSGDTLKELQWKPHCAIIDCEMPELSGVNLYEKLKGIYPDLPVIFVSGYDQEELEENLTSKTCCFMRKPFRFEDLIHKIEQLTLGV